MNGVSAMAEFLRRFWKTCGAYLDAELARKKISAKDMVVPHFLFSIPAVWNTHTTKRMESAIQQSNMLYFDGRLGRVDVITEPKAAAIDTFPRLAAWGIRVSELSTRPLQETFSGFPCPQANNMDL
jgi:hypothetical protein